MQTKRWLTLALLSRLAANPAAARFWPAIRRRRPLAIPSRFAGAARRLRRWPALRRGLTLGLLCSLLLLSGCYYTHLAQGQARLLWGRRAIDDVLQDPDVPEPAREKLALVERARAYAKDLGLDVDGRYTSFAPWPGDRVLTTVVATRPGEIEPASFDFPIVGRVPYKGFFDVERAEAEAERLRGRGLDVCLVPVSAYSTLGWFDDPVTGPMLLLRSGKLAETVIHELVHATVFASDAARFNEGLATFVGQEGSVRFFAGTAGEERAAQRRAAVADGRAVAAVLEELRDRIAGLYAGEEAGPERARRRRALEAEAREALAALPLRTRDPEVVAERARLNDACLSLTGTYVGDLPLYERKLESLGGDLTALIKAARKAASEPEPRATLLSAPPEDGSTSKLGAAARPAAGGGSLLGENLRAIH